MEMSRQQKRKVDREAEKQRNKPKLQEENANKFINDLVKREIDTIIATKILRLLRQDYVLSDEEFIKVKQDISDEVHMKLEMLTQTKEKHKSIDFVEGEYDYERLKEIIGWEKNPKEAD